MTSSTESGTLLSVSIKKTLDALKMPMREGGPKINVVKVGSREAMRELFRRESEIVYPFFSVMVESARLRTDSFNTFRTEDGVRGSAIDGGWQYKWNLVPLALNLAVRFHSDDYQDIEAFIEYWFHKRKRFAFDLRHGKNFVIEFYSELTPEVQIPEETFEETGNLFVLETNLTLNTWAGTAVRTPLVGNSRGSIVTAVGEDLIAGKTEPLSDYTVIARTASEE